MESEDERYAIERAKWDAHAHTIDTNVEVLPPDATFESHASDKLLLTGVVDYLGPLAGRELIEYGCGTGELSVLLARSGARVTAFDISETSIDVARKRAELNGLSDQIEFVVSPGERLPFADESFDLAFGKAVLHHLDPERGAGELRRVLRPGGRAAFSEPLGSNPLLNFARARLPYPGKHTRGADIPLRQSDVVAWRRPFSSSHLRPIQLLAMLERALGFNRRFRTLRRLDALLLERLPFLGRFCRYAIIYLEK